MVIGTLDTVKSCLPNHNIIFYYIVEELEHRSNDFIISKEIFNDYNRFILKL